MLSFRIPSFISYNIIFLYTPSQCRKYIYLSPDNIVIKPNQHNNYLSPYGYIDEIACDGLDKSYAMWETIRHFDIIKAYTKMSYIGSTSSSIPSFVSGYYTLKLQPNSIIEIDRCRFVELCLEYSDNTTPFDEWYLHNDGIDNVIIIKESDTNCENIYNKIFTDILIALIRQSIGGSLIIELAEITSTFSIDLIYILGHFYEDVSIVKPEISECFTNEKFIFCYGMRAIDKKKDIYDMKSLLSNTYTAESFIIHNNIPHTVLKTITSAVSTCENIKIVRMNDFIKRPDKKTPTQLDIHKTRIISNCIKWCIKNDIKIKGGAI